MLTAGQTTSVKFKVNVMGTSTDPKVRLILGTSPEMIFDATSQGDDNWSAAVSIPESIQTGDYSLKVEVLLNGRLFQPMSRSISIGASAVAKPAPAVVAPIVAPTPAPEIKPQVIETPPSVVVAVAAEDEKPVGLSLLQSFAKAPAAPMKKRVVEKAPAAPITLASIDAAVTKTVSSRTVVETAKAVKSRAKVAKPIKLVKERLFYE